MYPVIKRGMDILVSMTLMLLLCPVFLILAAWVKTASPGPVIFRQERIGRNKRAFTIYKFRTMYESAPHMTPTHQLTHPKTYVTPGGGTMRQSSMDELPQLWNVFKGDMSLVGPRPALPNQEDLLDARDRYGANALRPGMTGWAQINGRDEIPVQVKARYDGEYAKKISLLFDLKCAIGTLHACWVPGKLRARTERHA